MHKYLLTIEGSYVTEAVFPLRPEVGGWLRHAGAEWAIVSAVRVSRGLWTVGIVLHRRSEKDGPEEPEST